MTNKLFKDEFVKAYGYDRLIEARRKFKTAKRIECVGRHATARGWVQFDFYAVDAKGNKYYLTDLCQFYSKAKRCAWITVCGSDRTLEGYLSIGYVLGFDFHDINQSKLHFA